MTFIYVLTEPDTGQIRYVGKTVEPDARFKAHLIDDKPSHKRNWIKNLKSRGLLPTMFLLFEVPEIEWPRWERATIKLFRAAGCELVNETEGGDGVTQTDEVRLKISVGNKGKKKSEAHCRALSLAKLGKKQSPELIEKRVAPRRGRKDSLQVRANKSAAQLGKRHTLEARAKMVESWKKRRKQSI